MMDAKTLVELKRLALKSFMAVDELLKRIDEEIEAGIRTQKVDEGIQMNFLGQDELMKALLNHAGFMKFFRKLSSERGGYRKALPIVIATFPKGKYVTYKSLKERLCRQFGWTKKPDYNYIRLLVIWEIKWHKTSLGERDIFAGDLFDYKLAKTWKIKPRKAFCANNTKRAVAFDLLEDAGLGEVAEFIKEKTS